MPLLATEDRQDFAEQQYQILQAIEPQLAQAILADDLTLRFPQVPWISIWF